MILCSLLPFEDSWCLTQADVQVNLQTRNSIQFSSGEEFRQRVCQDGPGPEMRVRRRAQTTPNLENKFYDKRFSLPCSTHVPFSICGTICYLTFSLYHSWKVANSFFQLPLTKQNQHAKKNSCASPNGHRSVLIFDFTSMINNKVLLLIVNSFNSYVFKFQVLPFNPMLHHH